MHTYVVSAIAFSTVQPRDGKKTKQASCQPWEASHKLLAVKHEAYAAHTSADGEHKSRCRCQEQRAAACSTSRGEHKFRALT